MSAEIVLSVLIFILIGIAYMYKVESTNEEQNRKRKFTGLLLLIKGGKGIVSDYYLTRNNISHIYIKYYDSKN